LCDVGDFVDVELVEAGGGVLVGEPEQSSDGDFCGYGSRGSLLDDLGRDDFAGSAPCREAVEDHQGVLLGHGRVECILTAIRQLLETQRR
jgi:hypothetical protein